MVLREVVWRPGAHESPWSGQRRQEGACSGHRLECHEADCPPDRPDSEGPERPSEGFRLRFHVRSSSAGCRESTAPMACANGRRPGGMPPSQLATLRPPLPKDSQPTSHFITSLLVQKFQRKRGRNRQLRGQNEVRRGHLVHIFGCFGRRKTRLLHAKGLRRAYSAEAAAKAGSGYVPLAKAETRPLVRRVWSERECFDKEEWWSGAELNRRHLDFQSSALPTELPLHSAQSA